MRNPKPKPTSQSEHPLFFPDDDPFTRVLIMELIERKRFIKRPARHHLKHRKVNYYPSTEVITIDGLGRHPETGPDAFLDLLDQLYPKGPPKYPDSPNRYIDEEPPPPPPPIFEIRFDDDDFECTSLNDNEKSEESGFE